jgi:hypothetical protein
MSYIEAAKKAMQQLSTLPQPVSGNTQVKKP